MYKDVQSIVKNRTLYYGGGIMLAVNYTNLRDNMKTYLDKVTDDYETMIITRKDNKNVVMLSEESYNNLMENVYIMGNKTNYDWLMESKAQLEKGKVSTKINSLIEDICRNGNEGIGKPEPLTGNLAGFWSRRINDKDRLIYKIDEANVYILACRYHYSDT